MNDAIYKIKEQTIKDIANAIRAKAGKNDLISPLDMAEEILNLPLGDIDFSQQTVTEENVEEGYTFYNKHGLLSTGTGGCINFKIVGGTTQPTNPKENTIWVQTEVPIAYWGFSDIATPNWIADYGTVYFTFRSSNSGASHGFSALKNNEFAIIITKASQTDGTGAWLRKDAYIYKNGEWLSVVGITLTVSYSNTSQKNPGTKYWEMINAPDNLFTANGTTYTATREMSISFSWTDTFYTNYGNVSHSWTTYLSINGSTVQSISGSNSNSSGTKTYNRSFPAVNVNAGDKIQIYTTLSGYNADSNYYSQISISNAVMTLVTV